MELIEGKRKEENEVALRLELPLLIFIIPLYSKDRVIVHASAPGNFALFQRSSGTFLSNVLKTVLNDPIAKKKSFQQICTLVNHQISSLERTMVHLEDRQIALVQMSEVSSCLTRELYFFDPAIESTNQNAIGKAIYFEDISVSDSRLG